MYINSQEVSEFFTRINSLKNKDKLIAILFDRYEYGFPNKFMFSKYKYKYNEGIKAENVDYLDEFNHYYYTKVNMGPEIEKIIGELKKLYDITDTINEKTFISPRDFVVSLCKVTNIQSNLHEQIEKQVILNKQSELEKCLSHLLQDILTPEIIKSTIEENTNWGLFDALYAKVKSQFMHNPIEYGKLILKSKTLLGVAKWMCFSQEIKYLEEIEETYNFDGIIERVFRLYENKFIENGVNKLEEYSQYIENIEKTFLENYKTIGIDQTINQILSTIELEEEKEMISDYLYSTASIEKSMESIDKTMEWFVNILKPDK